MYANWKKNYFLTNSTNACFPVKDRICWDKRSKFILTPSVEISNTSNAHGIVLKRNWPLCVFFQCPWLQWISTKTKWCHFPFQKYSKQFNFIVWKIDLKYSAWKKSYHFLHRSCQECLECIKNFGQKEWKLRPVAEINASLK